MTDEARLKWLWRERHRILNIEQHVTLIISGGRRKTINLVAAIRYRTSRYFEFLYPDRSAGRKTQLNLKQQTKQEARTKRNQVLCSREETIKSDIISPSYSSIPRVAYNRNSNSNSNHADFSNHGREQQQREAYESDQQQQQQQQQP